MDSGQNARIQKFNRTRRQQMKGFVLGIIVGILICTVGLSGIARILDNGVARVQEVSKEAAK
jgi:flagellar biosynthesis protein FliR